jgi:two-component system, chemotaxis family, chemotaxis protein CheY
MGILHATIRVCQVVVILQNYNYSKQRILRPVKNYDLSHINVMLVEKHGYMRRLLRDVLRQLGIRSVRDCDNIEQAYEMFDETPADLVMTDWSPGLDGLYLVKQLRNTDTSPNPFVPVIVITANTETRHIYAARDSGMTEFLAKPITAKRVYSRVCSVIEKQRMFISNEEFFGPDRRRLRKDGFEGKNRRSRGNTDGPERRGYSSIAYAGRDRRNGNARVS